jgi:hypothetical protein
MLIICYLLRNFELFLAWLAWRYASDHLSTRELSMNYSIWNMEEIPFLEYIRLMKIVIVDSEKFS